MSNLRSADQRVHITKLVTFWPYAAERRAFAWPMYIASFTNSVAALYVCKFVLFKLFA